MPQVQEQEVASSVVTVKNIEVEFTAVEKAMWDRLSGDVTSIILQTANAGEGDRQVACAILTKLSSAGYWK